MPASTLFTCIAIGVVSGVVAALCGVGGGVVMVPAFVTLLGMPQKVAVATSLAVIIPTAITATVSNSKNGFVDWKVFAATFLSAAILAHFASGWLKALSNETLTKIFGAILIVFGLRMLLQGRA